MTEAQCLGILAIAALVLALVDEWLRGRGSVQ